MTTIERIRAEIERRIRNIESCPFIQAEVGAYDRQEGKLMVYRDLLAWLDTLEEEPIEGLDEAAREYASEQSFYWIRENPYTSQEYAFKAGAEWMKAKMMVKEDGK